MYAIVCPFCEHKNSPDTRFCAKCGSSIHLKICANPKCGKVNEINANVCVECGEPFLKSSIVEIDPATGNGGGAVAEGDHAKPAPAPAPKSRVGVWPLLMVAIVAGGLPLIWANRSLLPTPKTWQGNSPAESKEQAAPVKLAPKIELPKAEPPAPPNTAAPSEATSSPPTAAPATANSGDKPAAAPAKPKKPAKTPAPKRAAPERACTDATIALGLCEPKKAAK